MARFSFQRVGYRYLQIKSDGWFAVFDRGFCLADRSLEFIKQMDALIGAGQILKSGQTCSVSHATWNDSDIVIKRYNHQGLIHSLRHTTKKSRAHRAWLHAQRLRMLKINTPRPLAFIEQRKRVLVWKSYLVTEYVRGQNLSRFLQDSNVSEQQRAAVITQVAELLDKLAEHRITHGDLKHTNILVTNTGPTITDLDAMTVHRSRLSYRNRRVKDLERFLRGMPVSAALNSYARTLILRRTNVPGNCSEDFDRIRAQAWTIRIRKGFPKRHIARIISLIDRQGQNRERVLKVQSSDYTRVSKFSLSFDGSEHVLYLKQHFNRSVLDFAKHLLRPSRAKRAFRGSLVLKEDGFDVPCVIGLLERHFGPFCTANVLLTEEVADSVPLYSYISQFSDCTTKGPLKEKRELITSFGETVGRMHATGISHGDLRLGNVLVRKQQGKWCFFFIDNERTKKSYRLADRLRLKNLVQVNMTRHGIRRTDRLRFFKAYLCPNFSVQSRYKKWAQKVITRTSDRLRKKGWYEGEALVYSKAKTKQTT